MASIGHARERRDDHGRPPRVDELTRSIRAQLRHQIIDLAVFARCGEGLTLRGRSRTYYGKQLATEALRSAAPGVALRNEIIVAG